MPRTGHERFTQPTVAAHRRYEALRAYYVDELQAAEIAERFSYTKASVQTLISEYRQADMGELFALSRPGPKRQPKKDAARERAIELRRSRHGIEEIVAELERAGTPLSRTAVWEILREEGLSRMPKPKAAKPTAAPEQLAAEKVHVLAEADWPSEGSVQTQHAGLFLLIPELVALDLPGLVAAAGWPSTSQLPAIRSILSLLALKLSGRRRRSHVRVVVHDPALDYTTIHTGRECRRRGRHPRRVSPTCTPCAREVPAYIRRAAGYAFLHMVYRAARRLVVSPAQPGGTRKKVLGSNLDSRSGNSIERYRAGKL